MHATTFIHIMTIPNCHANLFSMYYWRVHIEQICQLSLFLHHKGAHCIYMHMIPYNVLKSWTIVWYDQTYSLHNKLPYWSVFHKNTNKKVVYWHYLHLILNQLCFHHKLTILNIGWLYSLLVYKLQYLVTSLSRFYWDLLLIVVFVTSQTSWRVFSPRRYKTNILCVFHYYKPSSKVYFVSALFLVLLINGVYHCCIIYVYKYSNICV